MRVAATMKTLSLLITVVLLISCGGRSGRRQKTQVVTPIIAEKTEFEDKSPENSTEGFYREDFGFLGSSPWLLRNIVVSDTNLDGRPSQEPMIFRSLDSDRTFSLLAQSRDGRLVARSHMDGSVYVYGNANPGDILKIDPPADSSDEISTQVSFLNLSPDGRSLAIGYVSKAETRYRGSAVVINLKEETATVHHVNSVPLAALFCGEYGVLWQVADQEEGGYYTTFRFTDYSGISLNLLDPNYFSWNGISNTIYLQDPDRLITWTADDYSQRESFRSIDLSSGVLLVTNEKDAAAVLAAKGFSAAEVSDDSWTPPSYARAIAPQQKESESEKKPRQRYEDRRKELTAIPEEAAWVELYSPAGKLLPRALEPTDDGFTAAFLVDYKDLLIVPFDSNGKMIAQIQVSTEELPWGDSWYSEDYAAASGYGNFFYLMASGGSVTLARIALDKGSKSEWAISIDEADAGIRYPSYKVLPLSDGGCYVCVYQVFNFSPLGIVKIHRITADGQLTWSRQIAGPEEELSIPSRRYTHVALRGDEPVVLFYRDIGGAGDNPEFDNTSRSNTMYAKIASNGKTAKAWRLPVDYYMLFTHLQHYHTEAVNAHNSDGSFLTVSFDGGIACRVGFNGNRCTYEGFSAEPFRKNDDKYWEGYNWREERLSGMPIFGTTLVPAANIAFRTPSKGTGLPTEKAMGITDGSGQTVLVVQAEFGMPELSKDSILLSRGPAGGLWGTRTLSFSSNGDFYEYKQSSEPIPITDGEATVTEPIESIHVDRNAKNLKLYPYSIVK